MDPANTAVTRYLSNATGATWTLTQTTPSDSLARVVTITNDSATDHSAKTAVLTGTDADGKAQTETLSLPAGSVAVTSLKHYLTLTTVVPSATIGADTMDIGIGDDIVSATIPLDHHSSLGATVSGDVTGTINVDIEVTFDYVNRPEQFTWTNQATPTWINATNWAGKTADLIAVLDQGVQACRARINTYTDTAEVTFWASQTENR